MSDDKNKHDRRDAETLKLMGGFLGVLSIPVLIGSFFAGAMVAAVVNVIAGLVLGGIGVGLFLRGQHYQNRL